MAKQESNKPRRPIEREYLATLNAAIPLDRWKKICERAAADALSGDSKARDWLSKWLLGAGPGTLTTLAAQEIGVTPEVAAENEIAKCRGEIEQRQKKEAHDRILFDSFYT